MNPADDNSQGDNSSDDAHPVFILGATGFIGRALTTELLERGYWVHALARPDSAGKLPDGCVPVICDALAAHSFAAYIPAGATLVHLIGTPHPAPWKVKQFQSVDLASVDALLHAARIAHAAHDLGTCWDRDGAGPCCCHHCIGCCGASRRHDHKRCVSNRCRCMRCARQLRTRLRIRLPGSR
ncbi:MAG: NAD-dependent epimerase/dehydratase family protein [Gammaproteobacteria bacterium]|nr:NAD-dependent epimerase/dehydratase family protein [Gammaproteobacteria bacterium]